jgi:hypothetical protein
LNTGEDDDQRRAATAGRGEEIFELGLSRND